MNDLEYTEFMRSSGKISRRALMVLRDLEIPNIPACYHVAYELCEDSNPNSRLKEKMESSKGEREKVLNDVQNIYYDLIAVPQEKELKKFAKRFHQLVASTSSSVHQGQKHLADYANYLKDIRPFLEPDSGADVLNITTLLIKETESVRLHAKEMENKLQQAKLQIKQLEDEQLQMKKIVHQDSLTGVLNREGFTEAFTQAKMIQNNFPMAVLVADIDKFKEFNDKYGHLVGDSVLKAVSNSLQKNIKGIDVLARVGGEEFIILLMNTNKKDALKVAEKLRLMIEQLRIKKRKSEEMIDRCTLSIGVAQLQKNDDVYDIIEHADKAMYKAKESGRNNVKLFV